MKAATWNIDAFVITSWGNGVSYLVANALDGRQFFLQGDDATTWRDQYDQADEDDCLLEFLHQSMSDYAESAE